MQKINILHCYQCHRNGYSGHPIQGKFDVLRRSLEEFDLNLSEDDMQM